MTLSIMATMVHLETNKMSEELDMLNLIYEIKFNDPLLDLLYIFMILFISAIFGIITHILGANRGFTRTQFWWGFCLWVLGVCMVAAMPTYRIYDDEEMEDSEDVKGRELNHYAPALKPRTLNTKKV